MDIYVRNVPPACTAKQVQKFFSKPLQDCGIAVFHADKSHGKPYAFLTVLDALCGQRFLDDYGVPQNSKPHIRARKPLKWDNKFVSCTKNRTQSDFNFRALAYEASQQAARDVHALTSHKNNADSKQFAFHGFHCGMWDYSRDQLVFKTHYFQNMSGIITFGYREAIIMLDTPSGRTRIDLSYHLCDNVVLGTYADPSISFTTDGMAPRFYKLPNEDVLSNAMASLLLGSSPSSQASETPKKARLASIDSAHAKIAGVAFVYRMRLVNPSMVSAVRGLLSRNPKTPSRFQMDTPVYRPREPWERRKVLLDTALQDQGLFGSQSFGVRFQLTRLATNGRLPPAVIMKLLPKVGQILQAHGLDGTLHALRTFYSQIPPAGPCTEAAEYTTDALANLLEDCAESYDRYRPDNPYELARRYTHIVLIHKVVVTPAGTYLEGPEPEPANRILRKYASQKDKFLRVVFQDEDGAAVRYDARTNLDMIYHVRFRQVLDGTILIAGSGFSFLGFSHSSLRSQSCWFMAPVFHQGVLNFAPMVIKDLGDFSSIKTPAKCAARIGQAFTDTATSVELDISKLGVLPIVSRDGRDFSDGCGTISKELLEAVWRVYGTRRLLKPTILQIRFQGAKGVVSLDSRLKKQRLLLRSNMIKFQGSKSWDLEICGAAFRPLPMMLNRQFIKILEDLGVTLDAFTRLQEAAVDKLRCMTTSAINSATLLESVETTKATKVPSLIMLLDQIGLDYRRDDFLYGIVELAVVTQLRDIKYRGRIPVNQGVTLYGIMDETGYLREGEVYVAVEGGAQSGRDDRARPNAFITRSPALHPGDVQRVKVVSIPDNSPLKQLSNVVVFSQHGSRDLPSQLSGGDLDGDLYNVVWDRSLIPRFTSPPADYPRVTPTELDRDVTAKDMSDFFVKFMETDMLGMLSTMHLILADKKPMGTFSPECIQLAGMASTAVDYSKTGIPVDMRELPKNDRTRPDYMAPSPRVTIEGDGYLGLEEQDLEDDDAFEGMDTEQRPYRYYQSHKALGHLYRAIDERKFLQNMQTSRRAIMGTPGAASDPMTVLLRYMKTSAARYGVLYIHHQELARDIRATYDESLLDLLHTYGPTANSPVSEKEAFVGSILGRQGGAQGKPLRELSKTMRERFETVVEYATARILKGDEIVHAAEDLDDVYDDREFEALPRAIACLSVAMGERGFVDRRIGEMQSFKYIAAGVCLRELERYRITTFGALGPLPFAEEESSCFGANACDGRMEKYSGGGAFERYGSAL